MGGAWLCPDFLEFQSSMSRCSCGLHLVAPNVLRNNRAARVGVNRCYACRNQQSSQSPPHGTTKPRCGAAIATTFQPPRMRRRSMSFWRRYRRWRSICSPTIIPRSIQRLSVCRSPRCEKPNPPWPDMAPQFDCALRDLLRAAGCALVRQARAVTRFGTARSRSGILPYQSASRAVTLQTRFCDRQPKAF